MKTKHTSEDWKAYGYEVRQPGGRMIAEFGPQHTPPGEYPDSCRLEDEANAQRAVACVNACKGINPEAVPELLKELTALLSDRQQPAYYTLAEWKTQHPKARAAIAKATT